MSCETCWGYDPTNCPTCAESLSQVVCPECDGDGLGRRLAFNIYTRQTTEVTETAWMLLPDDEDAAEARGWNFCKAEEPCPLCNGLGKVWQDMRDNYCPL